MSQAVSSQLYQTLDIAVSPLQPGALEILCKNKQPDKGSHSTVYHDCAQYLSTELLAILQNLGLEPLYFVHFGSFANERTMSRLHTDLYKTQGTWRISPGAINWELTPGTTDWHWYDKENIPHIWPDLTGRVFSGIHHAPEPVLSTQGCVEIGHLSMARRVPYLVRTDIPHQVHYTCPEPVRMGLSVRFDPGVIATWDQACEVLAPLMA